MGVACPCMCSVRRGTSGGGAGRGVYLPAPGRDVASLTTCCVGRYYALGSPAPLPDVDQSYSACFCRPGFLPVTLDAHVARVSCRRLFVRPVYPTLPLGPSVLGF
jgi:hypothetical protein